MLYLNNEDNSSVHQHIYHNFGFPGESSFGIDNTHQVGHTNDSNFLMKDLDSNTLNNSEKSIFVCFLDPNQQARVL